MKYWKFYKGGKVIDSTHAARRIAQVSKICLDIFAAHEREAEQEAQDVRDFGMEADTNSIIIDAQDKNGVYWQWHRYIEFYSKFL